MRWCPFWRGNDEMGFKSIIPFEKDAKVVLDVDLGETDHYNGKLQMFLLAALASASALRKASFAPLE